MTVCCGTCGRWDTGLKIGEIFLGGKCRLDGKEKSASSMRGCLGWKQATDKELATRIDAEFIQRSDVSA